nr:MAG TPA: Flagellar and Swarming motility protein [Bacteriophage sp.]
MIIYLTRTNGNDVAINLNSVMYMEKLENGKTKIVFSCDAIWVKESLDEIRRMFFYGKKR